MIRRTAKAHWWGNLREGQGSIKLGSGAFSGKYSFSMRFEEEQGTNPEELIGAAHAACFSMALSAALSKDGYIIDEIQTEATVSMEKGKDGFAINEIKLNTSARVKDITMEEFARYALDAKRNCPVSKALAAVDIELEANLLD
jgi:osmotically inducible protein OsmC